jgi:hypothetical protein
MENKMLKRELLLRMAQGEILKKSPDSAYFQLGSMGTKRDSIPSKSIEEMVKEQLITIVKNSTTEICVLTENCNDWFKKHGLRARILANAAKNKYSLYFISEERKLHMKDWTLEESN